MHEQPQGPFKVAGYEHVTHQSMSDARCFAGRKQCGGDRRSMQIFDRHGSVVSLKRY